MGFYLGVIFYIVGGMIMYGYLYHDNPDTADSNAGCAVMWPLYGFILLMGGIVRMLRAVPVAIVDRINQTDGSVPDKPMSPPDPPPFAWQCPGHNPSPTPDQINNRPPPPPAPPSPYPQGRPVPPKPEMPPNDIVIEHEIVKPDKIGDV